MKYLVVTAQIFIAFGCLAQLPISVYDCSINDPEVTQAEVDAEDDFYKQCILFSQGNNYSFDQDDNKDVSARTQIHIEEGFHAGAFSSTGKMHLKLEEKSNLDVFSMNQLDLGAIPQFDKFELGIDLPNSIDQKILNFFNEVPDQLSPFDPEDIIVEADFYLFDQLTGTWSPNSIKIFGFYYEEFIDNGSDWVNQNTPYDFRIRYTPRIQGKWKCSIKVLIDQVEVFKPNDFTFEVVPSSLKDFTRVGTNKRYFKIGNEPFFPVGQNLPWPGRGDHYNPNTEDIEQFHLYHQDMEDLAQAGANYFRYILNPWSTGIEFEKLGHYEGRMTNAWETDRVIDLARDLDLRIHFNLQVHYPLERANPFGIIHWDWSAFDSGAYPNCTYGDDLGYCYSTELNLLTPKDFLQSQEAVKYYKMRLRYIISRWGYSPQISVLELLSEANNIGEHANLQSNGNGCPNVEPNLASPYLTDYSYPQLVYYWQNEMCRYIKQDLHHSQHPLGVNYTGHPTLYDHASDTATGSNIARGDLSYYSPYVDFWTWNSYSFGPERFEQHVKLNREVNENENYEHAGTAANINKPVMYSEIGITSNCDYDLTWRKMIALSPFDGSSGGINYHRNNNSTTSANIIERNNLWKVYGYVNDFIEGIPFDDDNWFFGYDDRNDDEADVVYLRRRDTQHRAAIGAIQNKTVNFFTGRDLNDIGSECWKNEYKLGGKSVYLNAKKVQPGSLGNRLEVTSLNKNTDYWIKWYNPFTGQYYPTTSSTTNNVGTLELNFPELGGDGLNSVVLFKAYEDGQPSFLTTSPSTQVNDDYLFRDFAVNEVIDSHFDAARFTLNTGFDNNPFSDSKRVKVIPNPNNGEFVIIFGGEVKRLEVLNFLNKPVYVLENPKSGQKLNLSDFASGVYYVSLISNEQTLRTKMIIK